MDQIRCIHCGQTYFVQPGQWAQYQGQTINCTKCGKPFTVAAPPAVAAMGAAPGAPPPVPPSVPSYAAPATPYSSGPYDQGPVTTNGWAIASLITGILSFCVPVLGSFAAIATGIVGIVQTSRPRVSGRGMAIAGLVLGLLSTLFVVPVGLSIFLPAFNRAREQANRVKCAANMRQIGMAALSYANGHGGQFPDDLDTLVRDGSLTPVALACPSSSDTPPSGSNTQAILADMKNPGHLSYIYLGKGVTTSAPVDAVLLYEPTANHNGDGLNVLFVDGHVEWLTPADAKSIQTQQSSGVSPIRVNAGP